MTFILKEFLNLSMANKGSFTTTSSPVGGLGKTPRHSTLQSRQKFSQIQCVITTDLASNHYRIMHLYAGNTRFTHFWAVLIPFCGRTEAGSLCHPFWGYRPPCQSFVGLLNDACNLFGYSVIPQQFPKTSPVNAAECLLIAYARKGHKL